MHSIFDISLVKTPSSVVIENVLVPKGVLAQIFSYLSAEELETNASVCKTFLKCIKQTKTLLKKLQKKVKEDTEEFNRINPYFDSALEKINAIQLSNYKSIRYQLANSEESLIIQAKNFYNRQYPNNPKSCYDSPETRTIIIHSAKDPFCNRIKISTSFEQINYEKRAEETRKKFRKKNPYAVITPSLLQTTEETLHITLFDKSCLNFAKQSFSNSEDCSNWIGYDRPFDQTSIIILDKKITTKETNLSITVKSFPKKANFILPDFLIYEITTAITEIVLKTIETKEIGREKQKKTEKKDNCTIN